MGVCGEHFGVVFDVVFDVVLDVVFDVVLDVGSMWAGRGLDVGLCN